MCICVNPITNDFLILLNAEIPSFIHTLGLYFESIPYHSSYAQNSWKYLLICANIFGHTACHVDIVTKVKTTYIDYT